MIGIRPPKKRGLFGSGPMNPAAPMPTGAPIAAQQPDMMPGRMMQEPAAKAGLGTRVLGKGWEDKAFALGGLLSGDGGAAANAYHQRGEQERMLQAKQQMAQAARTADREDFMFEHDYKRNNPAAAAPDAFERALQGAGIDPATPEGQQMYRARAESMARDPNDEFVVVPIPGRGTYAGPKSGMEAALGGGGAPAAPVGGLTPIAEGGPVSAPASFR